MTTTSRQRTTPALRVAVFVAGLAVVFAAAFATGRAVGTPDAPLVTTAPPHLGSTDGH